MRRPFDIDRLIGRSVSIELDQRCAVNDTINSVGEIAIAVARQAEHRIGHVTGHQLHRTGGRHRAGPIGCRHFLTIAVAQYSVLAHKTDHMIAPRGQRGGYLAAQQPSCSSNQVTSQISSNPLQRRWLAMLPVQRTT